MGELVVKSDSMEKCPICNIVLPSRGFDPSFGDNYHITCPACGKYVISRTMAKLLEVNDDYKKYIRLLSGATRQMSEKDIIVKLTSTNFSEIIESISVPKNPIDAIDRILIHFQNKAETYDSIIQVNETDYPIAFSKNDMEFQYLLRNSVSLGYIESISDQGTYRMKLKGWLRLEEISKRLIKSNNAFVAMWFSPDLNDAWENGLKPALIETGFSPIRIDKKEFNDKIDDHIVAEIKRSGLLVVDCTGNRQAVYFEAGFALGLGIPVIWACRDTEQDKKDLCFDTRQYKHIMWKDSEDLKKQLIDRINATVIERPR